MKQGISFFHPTAIRKGVFVQETLYEGNKNLLKFVGDHYKCPQTELLSAPKQSKGKQGKALRKLIHWRKKFESDEVPTGFFLTIIFSIQGSIHDITKYFNLYSKYGGWLTLIMFALIYIFIAMPLYMVFFFLSNYTRNSYIKIWLAVPILKGVSFSVAMLNFVSCILNMSLVSLHLFFILALCTDWLECGYYKSGTECIHNPNITSFCNQPNMKMPNVGTYVFLKHVVTSTFGDTINWYWIAILLALYGVFILGQFYSRKVLAPICRLTTIVWGVIFLVILFYEISYGLNHTLIPKTAGSFANLLEPTFWVACAKASLRRVMPGDLVTYGSITMVGMSPITMAVLMSLMRIVFSSTVANFYVISINKFIDFYGIRNVECLDVNGLTMLFCFIPDQLLHIDNSKFCLLFYHALSTYMGSMSTFLSINGFLTAITGDYPDAKEYKNTVVLIMCAVMCFANLVVIGVGFEYLLFEEMKIIVAPLLTYACVAFFISSYSPLRISNDFYFAYGQRLATYWSSLMKFYVIFVSTIATLYVMFDMHNMGKDNAVGANVVALLLIITPIVVFAGIRIYRAKEQRMSLVQPDSEWGSPNTVLRTARAAFDAKRECRLLMELRCHHECLVESKLNEQLLLTIISKYTLVRGIYVARLQRNRVT